MGVELLGHMVLLEELPGCFPKWQHYFTFSPAMYEGSISLNIHTHFFFFLNSSHPSGYEVACHCGFDFHFPDV